MKYELTDETIEVYGKKLRRVRYLETGELGGWIEGRTTYHKTAMRGFTAMRGRHPLCRYKGVNSFSPYLQRTVLRWVAM